jgi:enterochelin esterase-like enzyme
LPARRRQAIDDVTVHLAQEPNRPERPLVRFGRPAIAAAVGAAVLLALRLSGSLPDASAALEMMGFDPERARLITDLAGAATIGAIASFATSDGLAAVITAIAAGGALYWRQFLAETRAAMATSGTQGSFDPAGWAVTAATLAVAFAIVAWAASALALIVRRLVLAGWSDAVALARGARPRRRAVRPVATVVAIVLVVATLPVFADMVNFAPDVHMRSGQGDLVGLTQIGSDTPPVAGPSLPASVLAQPTLLPGSSSGRSQPVLLAGRPWAAWQPSGQGTVDSVQLPAPWTGGTKTQAALDLYLPPGYGSATRAYPVVYELPWALVGAWASGMHATGILDTLIDSGLMPASIVAFVGMTGGPEPTGECADSTDHREWLEQYLTDTVVPYVDTHYRTIATPAARGLLGYSQGGFCAAMLAMRHPDVFATAMAISGYFQAGIRTSETPNAWRPFGADAGVEAAYSPVLLAARVSPADRGTLFFELSARPDEAFFGPQYAAFAAALHDSGIPVALFPSAAGHSWQEVRTELPALLEMLGQRENALGVFR